MTVKDASDVVVRIQEHANASRKGEAVIVFPNLTEVPKDVSLRIEPTDAKPSSDPGVCGARKGWPDPDIVPRSVTITERGAEFVIGPDVVGSPALKSGVAVTIAVPALGLRSDVIWPSLGRARSSDSNLGINGWPTSAVRRSQQARPSKIKNGENSANEPPPAKLSERGQEEATVDFKPRKRTSAVIVPVLKPKSDSTFDQAAKEAASERHKDADTLPNRQEKATALEVELARIAEELNRVSKAGKSMLEPDETARPSSGAAAKAPPSPRIATPAPSKQSLARRDDGRIIPPKIPAKLDARAELRCDLMGLKPHPSVGPTAAHHKPRERKRLFVAFLSGMLLAMVALIALLVLVPDLRPSIADTRKDTGELLALPRHSPLGEFSDTVGPDLALTRADHHLNLSGSDNRHEAKYWLGQAVAKGLQGRRLTWALTQLGSLSVHHDNKPPVYRTARLYWNLAASAGDPIAMCFLGRLAHHGLGGPKDYEKALYWYNRAKQAGGCADANKAIEQLQKAQL